MSVNDDLWQLFTEAEKADLLAKHAARNPATPAAGQYSTWDDIAATLGPITWSWPGWLPNGLLTVVAAEPGVGKSALCLRIAQTLIGNKIDWPDGTLYDGGSGRVVWAESESGQAINLERAKAWGLDTARLLQPGLPLDDFRLDDPDKWQSLCELAFLEDVRAVVIDSLRGANTRDENSSDVITLVMKLAELARDCNKPILLTHHLRKRGLFDGDGLSLDRMRGSSAIGQPARVVWALDTPDLQDRETRRLSQMKNNLARKPQPLGLTIGAAGVTFVDAPEAPRQISQQDAAINFLLALLEAEALPAEEVLEQARLAGHSERTVKRAKDKLGVVSLKKGGGSGPWYWGLPAKN